MTILMTIIMITIMIIITIIISMILLLLLLLIIIIIIRRLHGAAADRRDAQRRGHRGLGPAGAPLERGAGALSVVVL